MGVPTIYVLSKNKKNIKMFPVKFFIFTTKQFSVYCMGVFSKCCATEASSPLQIGPEDEPHLSTIKQVLVIWYNSSTETNLT